MHTHEFKSVAEYVHAIISEVRHPRDIEDELLSRGVEEYRLWQTDTSPDRKPFADDLRDQAEWCAAFYQPFKPKPGRRVIIQGRAQRRTPTAANLRLFELFGIDWKAAA